MYALSLTNHYKPWTVNTNITAVFLRLHSETPVNAGVHHLRTSKFHSQDKEIYVPPRLNR